MASNTQPTTPKGEEKKGIKKYQDPPLLPEGMKKRIAEFTRSGPEGKTVTSFYSSIIWPCRKPKTKSSEQIFQEVMKNRRKQRMMQRARTFSFRKRLGKSAGCIHVLTISAILKPREWKKPTNSRKTKLSSTSMSRPRPRCGPVQFACLIREMFELDLKTFGPYSIDYTANGRLHKKKLPCISFL